MRTIPVLGNGDIWTAADAVRMMAETGCDGVVVGRGCLGRPWLFGDLADAFAGRPVADPPPLGEVLDTMAAPRRAAGRPPRRGPGPHRLPQARALVPHRLPGRLRGPQAGSTTPRRRWPTSTPCSTSSTASIEPIPGAVDLPRGTHRGPQTVTLPDRWLADRDSAVPPGALAEVGVSGG